MNYEFHSNNHQQINFWSVLNFCTQVLDLWHEQLDPSFTVKQFVEEITVWERKGFVEPDIWTSLESSLPSQLLPSSMNI